MKVKGRKKSANVLDFRKGALYDPQWSLKTSTNNYINIRSSEHKAKKAGGSKGKRFKSTGYKTGGGF